MAKTIEEFLHKKDQWQQELQVLRNLCLETSMDEEIKWGSPIYTLNGKNVVGMMAFKSYVGLWFHQGVFLKDQYNLLEQSSDATKGLRKMMFHSLDEIEKNMDHIRNYIREAIHNQNAGKEIKVNRAKKLEIPPELMRALEKESGLQKAFDMFTDGKKREFADYIRSAKQSATKERRIAKISALIREGIGLHDHYK